MTSILSYGCTSAAGPSVQAFWEGLGRGLNTSGRRPLLEESHKIRDVIVSELLLSWQQTWNGLSAAQKTEVPRDDRLGVIFASTKGAVDDFIWNPQSAEIEAQLALDPYTPILDQFLKCAEIHTQNRLSLSNACASSLSALYLAQAWLAQGRVTHVLVLAADQVGRFVTQGFGCLQATTTEQARPFAKNRSGLKLGEAAAAILLSRSPGPWHLEDASVVAEGFAATRPSEAGRGLREACLKLRGLGDRAPDLIVAHGTATLINDAVEDRVFNEIFGSRLIPITATKGSIGHTLGASGAMDVIAACEAIRHQKAFQITNTFEIDPHFKGKYLSQGAEASVSAINRVLITSLGFGGINAAALVAMA